MKKYKFLYDIVFILFLLFPGIVRAQSVPAGQDIGAQGKRFQAEAERQRKALEGKEKKAVPLEMGEERAQVSAADVKFVIRSVIITGTTLFKPEEFTSLYQSLIGKEATLADVWTIAEKIKARYKAKSYLTTTVEIPEQEIKDGVVEIHVIEGRVGNLKVEGNKFFSTKQITKYFQIKEKDLLDLTKMLKNVLRLNQSSDLQVRTVVSAGEKVGTSDITLKVKDNFPWHIGVSEDNAGTRLTGKYRTGLTLRGTNVTGNMDTFFLSTSFSRSSAGQSASYRLPVGDGRTKIGLDATYFQMRLGREYYDEDIVGKTQIYTPQLIQELWLGEESQGSAILGMEVKSIHKTADDVKITNDQLRILFMAFDISKDDALGQTNFNPRFNVSLKDALGASERNHLSASRQGTGGEFEKYEQGLSRIQRMPWGSYATLRTQLQVASRTLPSSEQLQLGGMNSVRGYPEGDYMADTGGIINADWFLPFYLIPENWVLPGQTQALRNQVMPIVFMDYGAGHLKRVNPGEAHDKTLMGMGGGLRMRFGKSVMVRLEWAKDMKNKPVSGSGPSTFYLHCQAEF